MTCSHYVQEGGPYYLAFHAAPPEVVLPWQPVCEDEGTVKAKARRSKVAYQCPSCGIKAWGKPGLELMCLSCDEPLEP
jgi:hypothetical protein